MKIYDHLLQKIASQVYEKLTDLSVTCYKSNEPIDFYKKEEKEMSKLNVGETWGSLFDCAWFILEGKIPKYNSSKNLVLQVDIGGEGVVYDKNFNILASITNKKSSYGIPPDKPGKWIIDLNKCKSGDDVVFYVDGSCNDLFGYVQDGGRISDASIATINLDLKELYYDLEVLIDWYNGTSAVSSHQPKGASEDEINKQDLAIDELENILLQVSEILKELNSKNIKKAKNIIDKFYKQRSNNKSLEILATGHAHLDIAWMWPVREGRRKALRTFATALYNIEKYDDYIFGASQQQLFEYVKHDDEKLFMRIKEQVKKNRFEIQGSFWVESDLNIPCGESLIRQIHYGKKFNKEEFDITSNYLWQPDVFGFTASIPQILKKSGLEYMCSQKLSQNMINKFPHHSFKWEGNDDSYVLVHHFPENTYDSRARVNSVLKLERNYIEKDIVPIALLVYGVGDGGAGPGEEHLERIKRIKDLKYLPKVKNSRVDSFLKEFSKYEEKLPIINGELYFERHQGTYTTEALNKKGNRDMEYLLKEYEYLIAINKYNLNENVDCEELDEIWKEVLLYQFHDIIPGSSIVRVYKESRARYEILIKKLKSMIDKEYEKVLGKKAGQKVIINNSSIDRDELITIDGKWYDISVKALSFSRLDNNSISGNISVDIENKIIESNSLKVEFNNNGALTRLYNKSLNKEFIDGKRLEHNVFIYTERANEYPAWDFDENYRKGVLEHPKIKKISIENDDMRAVAKMTYTYKKSSFTLEYIVIEGSQRVDIKGYFDWKDIDTTVKITYPITVKSKDALCNIQYGNINRPTHSNTSHDYAMDEICAHKFVDISERDYGIAMLSTCKYGFRVKDQSLEVTILRSQKKPGEEIGIAGSPDFTNNNFGDLTEHEFLYSIFTHNNKNREVDLYNEAIAINMPIIVANADEKHLAKGNSFVRINNKNTIIDYVKVAFEKNGYVVRVLNLTNEPQEVRFLDYPNHSKVSITNLQEEFEEKFDIAYNFKLKKYEVKTFLFEE